MALIKLDPIERKIVELMELGDASAAAVAQTAVIDRIGIQPAGERAIVVQALCRHALDKIADAIRLP